MGRPKHKRKQDSPEVRLSKTMSFLLKHRPDVGNLTLATGGWVELDELCGACSALLKQKIETVQVEELVNGASVRRFEIRETRIRAVRRTRNRFFIPDILYHATTAPQASSLADQRDLLQSTDRPLFLSTDEAHAWRVAHRQAGDEEPAVLYVDASRARRHGIRFQPTRRPNLFTSERIPTRDILNLQRGFAKQPSAGGIPVAFDSEGTPRLALIKVTRRSGVTWEVAKGKLEPGEPPERTAVREVQEEMGFTAHLNITRDIGEIRYGFLAPGGLPRLKIVYMYLMTCADPPKEEDFCPSEREGIGEVRWFSVDEALRSVTHSSLQPLMRRVRDMLSPR